MFDIVCCKNFKIKKCIIYINFVYLYYCVKN